VVADVIFVFAKAMTASELAPKADPALNPNYPNQRRPVPKITNGTLTGS